MRKRVASQAVDASRAVSEVQKPVLEPDSKARVKIVAYVRVSSEEQAVDGISLQFQEDRLRAYCAMRGVEIAEVIADAGVSGSVPLGKRPGGKRLVELVKSKSVGAIVAWKLDRLFRDCADCLDTVRLWDDADVALHLVDLGGQAVDTRSAMGRFFLTMMAGAAELERNQICERTQAGMDELKRTGKRAGTLPLGKTALDDGTLVPDERAMAAMARARRLRAGGAGYGAIAKQLNAEGFRSQRGGEFVPTTVRRYLEAA